MKETLKALIAESVVDNAMFSGTVGSSYTIQDLLHSASLQTINKMYQSTRSDLSKLETDSLYKNPNSSKRKSLEFQSNVLREVFEYKQELAEASKKAAEEKEKRVQRLATLKNVQAVKELEKLGNMSLDDVNAEIAALENV